MRTVYIETTIFSYLVSRPSSALLTAANQLATHSWWTERRSRFRLVTSHLTRDEAAQGDQRLADLRLELIQQTELIAISSHALKLAADLVTAGAMPKTSMADALHIATAAVHRADYLLTWNCTHIANATIQKQLMRIAQAHGLDLPQVCTPPELMTDIEDGGSS